MSTILHAVLPILGRVAAGAAGCFTFYIALFLYEDEKQQWRNRLESIWVQIHERARQTDTVFTALVNKVGGTVARVFDAVFGKETFSIKLVAVSVNLSFAVADVLGYFEWHFIGPWWRIGFDILSGSLALASICTSRKLLLWALAVPVPAYFLVLMGLQIFYFHIGRWDHTVYYYSVPIASILISCAVDAIALVIIRKTLLVLENAPSVAATLDGCGTLVMVAAYACAVPLLPQHYIPTKYYPLHLLFEGFWYVGLYDQITVVYCLAPSVVLFSLVAHKIMWPLLARFTYPLLEFKVLSERKFLIPVGTVAFGIAFGVTRSRVLEFFALFK